MLMLGELPREGEQYLSRTFSLCSMEALVGQDTGQIPTGNTGSHKPDL